MPVLVADEKEARVKEHEDKHAICIYHKWLCPTITRYMLMLPVILLIIIAWVMIKHCFTGARLESCCGLVSGERPSPELTLSSFSHSIRLYCNKSIIHIFFYLFLTDLDMENQQHGVLRSTSSSYSIPAHGNSKYNPSNYHIKHSLILLTSYPLYDVTAIMTSPRTRAKRTLLQN